MSPKNATSILFSAFLLLTGVVIGSLWWFTKPSHINLRDLSDRPSSSVEASNIRSFAQVQVPSGTFSYGGSTTWAPIRGEIDPVIQTTWPRSRNQLNLSAFQSGKYPITRQLFVIVKQNRQPEQQAGEAYVNLLLTVQGQDEIAKAGFIKVNAPH